jgi:holo-[acyl-carrier protein] synthase
MYHSTLVPARKSMSASLPTPGQLNEVCSFPQFANVAAVGIDLTLVSDVRDSLAHFGDRYLRRVFTAREYADSCSSADPAPHLAARFAAKEATLKALKVEGAQPEWTSMEVRRHPLGWCDEMHLTGSAARLAAHRGVDRLCVSLSHEGDAAVAVVVATRPLHHSTAPASGQVESALGQPR